MLVRALVTWTAALKKKAVAQPAARRVCNRVLRSLLTRPISSAVGAAGYIAIVVVAVLDSVGVGACVAGPNGTGVELCLYGQSYWTLSLLLGALLLMVNEAPPDLVMLAFTMLLVLAETISDAEAWAGFSSTSVLSIGALFVVARALEETRAVEKIILPLLGHPRGHRSALLRLCAPVALFSAFLNNTPIVAMLITVCERWAARCNLSIKVLLMPLSFASMLGGMCTLIGTSTNLVLNAQIEADPNAPLQPLSMFSMSLVAFPAAVVGICYLSLAAPCVFRARLASTREKAAVERAVEVGREAGDTPLEAGVGFGSRGSPRYTLEAVVTSDCSMLLGQPAATLGALVIPACASLCEAVLTWMVEFVRHGRVDDACCTPSTHTP